MSDPPDDRRSPTAAGPPDPPLRVVASDQGRELFAHWFGALVMAGMFGTVAVGILVDEIRTEPFIEWLLLAVAALAPVLLVGAVIETFRWLRFRRVVLELDPAPGSLDGEVGGRIQLPLRSLRADQCSVTLSCIRVRKDSDSSFETVVWSAERTPWMSFAGRGMEVSFAFAPPPDLPPSNPSGGVVWAVRLVGDVPGLDLDLDLSFPVEVTRGPTPRLSTVELLPAADPGSSHGRRGRIGPGIRLERTAGALVFRYGMRRSMAMGIAFSVFGAVFLGSGVFIFRTVAGEVDGLFTAVFLAFGGLFLLVFGLLGLGLVLIGLHLVCTTRRVEVTPGGLRARWRFLLFGAERAVRLEEVDRIVARVMGQVGQGAKASVRYEIKAHLKAGGAMVLGDGIRGAAHLDRITGLIERETGKTVELERRGPRRTGTARLQAASDGPDRTD